MDLDTETYLKLITLEEGLWQSEFRFDTQWMEQVLAADFLNMVGLVESIRGKTH